MKAVMSLLAVLLGFALWAGNAPDTAAARRCPAFIIASGQGDLCSPSAWMAFEHDSDKNVRSDKNKLKKDGKSSKVKFRPPRGNKNSAKPR